MLRHRYSLAQRVRHSLIVSPHGMSIDSREGKEAGILHTKVTIVTYHTPSVQRGEGKTFP